jgi:hypothetical protein
LGITVEHKLWISRRFRILFGGGDPFHIFS